MSKYYTKHWLLLLLATIFSILSSMIRIYIPIIIGRCIDEMIGIGLVDFKVITTFIMNLLVLIAMLLVMQSITTLIINKFIYTVSKQVRDDMFIKLQHLPLSYLDSHLQGETVTILLNDTNTYIDGISLLLNSLFSSIITIVGILFFMFSINSKIAWLVVILTPLSLLIANFIATRTRALFKQQTILVAKQSGFMDEAINNQKMIKAFNYQTKIQHDFDDINDKLIKHSTKALFYSSLVNPSTRFINNTIYAITGLLSAIFALQGIITIGSMSVFLSYANEFGKPFSDLSSILSELQSSKASKDRILSILNSPEEKQAEEALVKTSEKTIINFENVCFSYQSNKPIINDFSLKIKDGHHIAIVGKTGCGKTTLINLLLRFYDVDAGDIKLNDQSIYSVSRESLRQQFGMVLQDSWIKQASIKDNLTLANPAISQAELIQICELTHCNGFINRLQNKYDTIIDTEDMLSQGQRQLLSIARVMVANPKILILDEATSSLDTATELKVQQALERLMHGKTSLIIAHRLSTIINSDLIIYVENGHIVEQGNHKELLALGGKYYELYHSQFANK